MSSIGPVVGVYYFDGWTHERNMANDTFRWNYPGLEPEWGWYDDSVEIMARQIDVASGHGVSFFAFDWYWNHGDPSACPMNTSIDLFQKARNRDRMRFCLLVANHDAYVIAREEWHAAVDAWMPYLSHESAMTVDGKPMIIIFMPRDAPGEGLAYLQRAATAHGLPGVSVVAKRKAIGEAEALELGYTHSTDYALPGGWKEAPEPHPYAELADRARESWQGSRKLPHIPLVMSGWDRRPWELSRDAITSYHYVGRTPTAFGAQLEDAVTWMDEHPEQTTDERLLMIYAWNEYGEGGYIAPTQGDGYEYLAAVRAVMERHR